MLIGCGNLASMNEILNALLVKDTDGNVVGLRTVVHEAESCDTVVPVINCNGGGNLSDEDILRRIITTDSCGKPAICLVTIAP